MAELARTLLAAPDVDAALPVAAERIASALELPSAALRRGVAPDQPGRLSLPLVHDGSRLGTLVVPAGIDPENLDRLNERLLPGLEALLAAAIDRESCSGARSRPRRCAAATRSRPPCCGPSRTTCGRRSPRSAPRPRRSPRRPSGRGPGRPPGGDHRRLGPARRAGRQPARPLAAADGHRRAVHGLDVHRGGRRGRDRRPGHRPGPLPALDRRAPAVHQSRRRPARARLRQRARERGQVLGGRAGLGARPRGVRQGGDPGRRPRPRDPGSRAGADLRGLLPGRRRRRRIPARGSGWRSSRDSWRRTAARSRSSRCPARGRRSWSSSRWAAPAGANLGADVTVAGRAMSQRVLVCDDEPQILRALRVVLRTPASR